MVDARQTMQILHHENNDQHLLLYLKDKTNNTLWIEGHTLKAGASFKSYLAPSAKAPLFKMQATQDQIDEARGLS